MLLKLTRNHRLSFSSDFVLFEIVWRPLLIALRQRIIGRSGIVLLVNSQYLYFLLTEQPKVTNLGL